MKPVEQRLAGGVFGAVFCLIFIIILKITKIELDTKTTIVVGLANSFPVVFLGSIFGKNYDSEKENNNLLFGMLGGVLALVILLVLLLWK